MSYGFTQGTSNYLNNLGDNPRQAKRTVRRSERKYNRTMGNGGGMSGQGAFGENPYAQAAAGVEGAMGIYGMYANISDTVQSQKEISFTNNYLLSDETTVDLNGRPNVVIGPMGTAYFYCSAILVNGNLELEMRTGSQDDRKL